MRSASARAPAWLAITAAGSLGAILVLAGTSAAKILAANSRARASAKGAPLHDTSARGNHQVAETNPEWTDRLLAKSCDGPCVGGSACSMTGNKACPSKFTCIPGERDSVLETLMPLQLRLSTLVTETNAFDTCSSGAVVCFTPASSQTSTCVPLSDTCSHDGRASIALPILASDLVFGGIVVTVRKGSSTGAELANATIRYGTPIRRVGLCTGFKAGGFVNRSGSNFKFVTFLLEPRAVD
jgi:hypothetical protein